MSETYIRINTENLIDLRNLAKIYFEVFLTLDKDEGNTIRLHNEADTIISEVLNKKVISKVDIIEKLSMARKTINDRPDLTLTYLENVIGLLRGSDKDIMI